MGEDVIECCPIRFDHIRVGASTFVAPYWIDNDPSIQGNVSYGVHVQGSSSLQLVSDFISRDQEIEFSGLWMLVAFWQDLPEVFFEEQVISVYVLYFSINNMFSCMYFAYVHLSKYMYIHISLCTWIALGYVFGIVTWCTIVESLFICAHIPTTDKHIPRNCNHRWDKVLWSFHIQL